MAAGGSPAFGDGIGGMLTGVDRGGTIRPRRRPVCRRPFHVLGFRRTEVKEVILTPEGYKKLQQEIEELSTVRRREVADRIRIAREFGDIAENAEYRSEEHTSELQSL